MLFKASRRVRLCLHVETIPRWGVAVCCFPPSGQSFNMHQPRYNLCVRLCVFLSTSRTAAVSYRSVWCWVLQVMMWYRALFITVCFASFYTFRCFEAAFLHAHTKWGAWISATRRLIVEIRLKHRRTENIGRRAVLQLDLKSAVAFSSSKSCEKRVPSQLSCRGPAGRWHMMRIEHQGYITPHPTDSHESLRATTHVWPSSRPLPRAGS